MGFELREALRRLCVEIGWAYAVFWRAVGSPIPMHLVWEDGHWHGKSHFSGCDNVSSRVNLLAEFQNQGECSIDELVCKSMVPQVHVIGDGIVGQAASIGNHQWILRDIASDREPLLPHLAELKNQFLSGIQTIVVIPMLPHGVVQFGSIMRVMENNLFVNHVRTSFMKLVCEPGSFVVVQEDLCQSSLQHASMNMDNSSPMRCNHQLSISSATRCHENVTKIDVERLSTKKIVSSSAWPIAESFHPMIHQNEKSLPHSNNRLENGMNLTAGNLSVMEENFRSVCGNIAQEPIVGIKASVDDMFAELDTYFLHPKFATMECPNGRGRFTSAPACTKGNIQNLFCNASGASSQGLTRNIKASDGNQGISASSLVKNPSINKCLGMTISGYPKQKQDFALSPDFLFRSCYGRVQECRLGSSSIVGSSLGIESAKSHLNHRYSGENVQSKGFEIDSGPLNLPIENSSHFVPLATSGDDLFDMLSFNRSLDRRLASEQQLAVDVTSCNTLVNSPTLFYPVNNDLSGAEIFSESNTDQLLDAVVSKINPGSRQILDEKSCKTTTTKFSSSSIFCGSHSIDGSASSGKKHGEYVSPSILTSNAETAASTSVQSADSIDETERSGCYKSQICLWVESRQNMRNDKLYGSHVERVDDISKVNRKRSRSGEVPRPRPKDRQLIMDRVKELRELVPNGAKCSIDALLEKTIKHMLFLQSVAKHADKLRDSGEPKLVSKDGGVLLKDNFEGGGATWAFEVGSQPMACPIIVEDLNPPREMLVEMLCDDRGVFLEIADLIRGLGLTILKGVMEARKNKIWARFAVEANRDVTRMEIFLSLVRSLEQAIGRGARSHSIHNSNMSTAQEMLRAGLA